MKGTKLPRRPESQPGASLMGNSAAQSQARYVDDQMINHFAQERRLPCRSDRTKIIEQAKLVLAEARAVAKQLDGSFVALIATPDRHDTQGLV